MKNLKEHESINSAKNAYCKVHQEKIWFLLGIER